MIQIRNISSAISFLFRNCHTYSVTYLKFLVMAFGYCSARSPSPRSGKKTPRNNATCNRGIYYWLEPGSPALTKGVRMKGPKPQFSRVFIRWKKAAGGWRKRIGYTAGSWRKRIGYTVARQFLLAQLGAFSFPLIGSLFLTRHMLIG